MIGGEEIACNSIGLQRESHLEQIKSKINRYEKDLEKLKKAKEILEKNSDIAELMDIVRSVGIY